jgi:uncharacterized protein DUF6527
MSIIAKQCQSFDEVCATGVGAYFFTDNFTSMILWLPNDHAPSSIRCTNSPEHPRWTLSGTPEKPTLRPSLHSPGVWHGWLTDGEFTDC